jgi:2-keto-4-pentenoate hydratase
MKEPQFKSSLGASETLLNMFADEMHGAFREHRLVRKGNVEIETLSIDQAYAVQERYLASRVAGGERLAGYKVGCTSPAIRAQFGLSQPVCGRLLSPYLYSDGARLDIGNYTDCALEPEFVLHVGADLPGDDLDDDTLRMAISGVSPGLEVHNYRFWYGRPTSQELIASNGLHAALVIGARNSFSPQVDLKRERVTLVINGVEAAAGFGEDIIGGPLESLRWLIVHLRQTGHRLRAGDLVIPGSPTQLVRVKPGDAAEARFTHFASCRAVFELS